MAADQPEPKGLSESELDLLESNFDGHASEYVYDRCGEALCEQQDVRSLITMARLSLTLQRRAEEAEARVKELEDEIEHVQHLRSNEHRPDVLFCTTHQRYYHQNKHCGRCLVSR